MTDLRITEYRPIGALIPFACTYRPDDDRPPMGPVIWETSEAEVYRNNAHLPRLSVEGVMVARYEDVK